MERRSASARPMAGSVESSAKARVVSFTAAADSTGQCETSSARAGIEEGSREPREGFRPRAVARGCVAGRKHHPVGVELELRHLAGREQAVVAVTWGVRGAESQRRLGQPL